MEKFPKLTAVAAAIGGDVQAEFTALVQLAQKCEAAMETLAFIREMSAKLVGQEEQLTTVIEEEPLQVGPPVPEEESKIHVQLDLLRLFLFILPEEEQVIASGAHRRALGSSPLPIRARQTRRAQPSGLSPRAGTVRRLCRGQVRRRS